MRQFIYGIGAAMLIAAAYVMTLSKPNDEIAVIVPMHHSAMDAIVKGLKEELGQSTQVTVYNAQGDTSLQAAILQKLSLAKPKAVLPIGTAATQMAISRLPRTPIIHLAAKFLEEDRAQGQEVSGVLDELPPEKALRMAALLIPGLKKVTLIHSASEKTFPEAAAFEEEGKRLGIHVQKLMIQSQNELYTMAGQIDRDTELLAVLKDHMVVAGIATLVETAKSRGIPVMATDEGSVQGGASFASGVPEASIGVAGAKLVKRLLSGEAASRLPITPVEDIHLFYRKEVAGQFDFEKAAKTLGYTPKEVEG